MRCPRFVLALVRLKSVFIAILAASVSSLVFAQDSFMMHYTPASAGSNLINRGDFNNDGIPDIITGNNFGTGYPGLSVDLGIGDGRFQNPINSAQTTGTFDMAIGDFNGDGKLDVALAGVNTSTQAPIIQIMLGNGNGTFTTGQTISLASNVTASAIATGDFNGDGKLDLALGTNNTNLVYLYKGAGNGTFSSAGTVAAGSRSSESQVRVGDFNGDGKVDLMVSNYTTLWVLWNTGNFTFSPVQLASTPYGVYGTPVDVNQDNFTDLVVTEYTCLAYKSSSCTTWDVLLGSANKTFKQSASMTLSPPFQGFYDTTAADINGDGINDIVGISRGTQPVELVAWLGNPDGSYQSTPLDYFLDRNSTAMALVASDFNRDGKIDFAIAGTNGETAVFLNATPRATCTPSTESPSVTVCQPQDLTYLNSPVDWIADSRDTSHPVTAMQIYVDNKLVVNSSSSSLNESLPMSNGSHSVVTKAWDQSGASFESPRAITIYSGTPGETCPAASSSMNVCLPTQNEITSTSLHVFANTDSSVNQITSVQVYIDGSLIYKDNSGATYVDTAFTVSKGSHTVVVKAWDESGNIYSESRNVTAQ